MALTITHYTPGPLLTFDGNQAEGTTAVSGARANPGLGFRIVAVTFDSTYPSGGESLTASDLDMTAITYIDTAVASTGYVTKYDHANAKLMAYGVDNAADGPLVQPSGFGTPIADLSATTVVLAVFGY